MDEVDAKKPTIDEEIVGDAEVNMETSSVDTKADVKAVKEVDETRVHETERTGKDAPSSPERVAGETEEEKEDTDDDDDETKKEEVMVKITHKKTATLLQKQKVNFPRILKSLKSNKGKKIGHWAW